MRNKVFECVDDLLKKVESSQQENIEKAARLFADALEGGGILQAFGSGHSQAGAMELCFRAGGFLPTKQIKEPAAGYYEAFEGIGTHFMKMVDIRPGDALLLISNSGRNPLGIEIAIEAKKKGAKIVTITSLVAAPHLTSRHSSGKLLHEFADVAFDNCVMEGDASIQLEGMDARICGMSSITTAVLIEATVCRTAELMLADGYEPPVLKSLNIDGGAEYNDRLRDAYFDRLYHI